MMPRIEDETRIPSETDEPKWSYLHLDTTRPCPLPPRFPARINTHATLGKHRGELSRLNASLPGACIRAQWGLSRLRNVCESPSPDSSVHYLHTPSLLPPLCSTRIQPLFLHIGIYYPPSDRFRPLLLIYVALPCPTRSPWPSKRRHWITLWTSRPMHRTSTRPRQSSPARATVRTARMDLMRRGRGQRAARKTKSHW